MPIEVESKFSEGSTLVPLIVMSNGTHLSNFAGDTKEWPVYMTSGNVASIICQMGSTHTVGMVALLPITIKYRNIPQQRLVEHWQTNLEVLNKVLQ